MLDKNYLNLVPLKYYIEYEQSEILMVKYK